MNIAEYQVVGSVVVSERYSGILLYTSAVKRLMCVVQTRERVVSLSVGFVFVSVLSFW